jgi:hypothetical protein
MSLQRYEDLPVKWHFNDYSVTRDDGLTGKIERDQPPDPRKSCAYIVVEDGIIWSDADRWRYSTATREDRSRVLVLVLIDVLTSARRTKRRLCKALIKSFPEGKQQQALIQLIETGHTYNLDLSQEEFELAASIITR